MKNIILIAAPAAGKGTEAAKLKKMYNIPHISTGDLLREAISKGNDKSDEINNIIKSGKLVGDELVLDLLKTRILQPDCKNGYILDGFPRNLEQAIAYDKILEEIKSNIDIVFVLDIDKEIAKSRISGRCTCPKCGRIYNTNIDYLKPENGVLCDDCNIELKFRVDDNSDTYEERYNSYIENTKPLISYYDQKGIVYHINSSFTPEETHRQIEQILGDKND